MDRAVLAALGRVRQTGLLQHREMLTDRLTREREPVTVDQSDAQLEQGLAIARDEFVEHQPTNRRTQRIQHIVDLHDTKAYTFLW